MARFSLPTLNAAQRLLAQEPEIGVESNVFVSPTGLIKLGTVRTDAVGAISWTPHPGAAFGSGLDLHVSFATPILGVAAPVITLDGTVVTSGAGTIVATGVIPAYVANQSHTYPEGYAMDMIPQGVGNSARLVTAIAGVTSLANVPANSELVIWGSGVSDFVEIGWKKSVDGAYSVSSTVSLANKYNPSAVTKKGVGEVNNLTMEFSHIHAMEGITRYDQLKVNVLVKVLKNGTVQDQNILYIGHRVSATPKRGEGNDGVVESSTGPVEAVLKFYAA